MHLAGGHREIETVDRANVTERLLQAAHVEREAVVHVVSRSVTGAEA
jgi:hypothetical protein